MQIPRRALALLIALTLWTLGCAVGAKQDVKIQDQTSAAHIRRAVKLYDGGRYAEALEKLSEGEAKSLSPEDKGKIAEIIAAGGFGLIQKNNNRAALDYYQKALEINKTIKAEKAAAANLSYIGKIHSDIGRYEDALGYFNQAIAIQREYDKSGEAHNLNNAANLLSYLGRYREAEALLAGYLSIADEINDPAQKAKTLINLGAIYHNQRNYKKSIETLKSALDASNAALDAALTADALALTASVYREQGKLPEAIDNYQRAREINEFQGDEGKTALTIASIGEAHRSMGRLDEALRYFNESLGVAERAGNKLAQAVALGYIGEVRLAQGDAEEATRLFRLSQTLSQEIGFRHGAARSLGNIGNAQMGEKNWSGAAESFAKASAIYRELGDREWLAASLLGQGESYEGGGDLDSAEAGYAEAVEALESVREDVAGGSDARNFFTDANIKTYERLVSLLIRRGKTLEALEYIERSKSKILRDNFLKGGIEGLDERTRGLAGAYNNLSRKEASLSVELLKENSKDYPSLEKIGNIAKTLADTRAEFKTAAARLKSEFPQIYRLLSINPGSFLALDMKKIPPKTVFIEYFVTDNATYVFLIDNRHASVKEVSITKAELNSLVSRFRWLIRHERFAPTGGLEGESKLAQVSVLLYKYLIAPVEEEIADADTVAVIPFGSLHYLPFHALGRESGRGRIEFLIETKSVVYLVSASAEHLGSIATASGNAELDAVAAFGNPDLGEPDLALPYSEQEVLSIKREFPSASVFIKKEATKDNFRQSWGKHEIIHLAAHGLIQDEPSILLAPLGSGSLTLSDIAGLAPAERTKLVVLSACEAAIDENEANPTGAELNSIAAAFSAAGAPSVIATLWRVDDRATFEVMRDFYGNLKSRRAGGDYEALRKAQIEMLRRADKYGQPFYWAPFVLLGAWR